ncbi:META domain-containing protein [Verticiella sediminum]|nr:META domain-containing protein [Verticiella sediminum]
MQSRAIFATAVCLFVTACAGPQGADAPGLEGTRWQLKSVSGRTLTIPEKPPIELSFMDSRVNFHGCNAQSGRYTQEGTSLRVAKGFVGTRMSCEGALMAIDDAAAALFEKGVTFKLQADGLTVQGNGETWRFERRDKDKAAPPPDLEYAG